MLFRTHVQARLVEQELVSEGVGGWVGGEGGGRRGGRQAGTAGRGGAGARNAAKLWAAPLPVLTHPLARCRSSGASRTWWWEACPSGAAWRCRRVAPPGAAVRRVAQCGVCATNKPSLSAAHHLPHLPATTQDVMAYLRLAVSLHDDVALARIINTPRRALGDTSLEKLAAAAAARGLSLSALLFGELGVGGAGAGEEAAALALPPLPDKKEMGVTPKAAAAVDEFRALMASLHAAVASQPLGRALETIIRTVRWGWRESSKAGKVAAGHLPPAVARRLLEQALLLPLPAPTTCHPSTPSSDRVRPARP